VGQKGENQINQHELFFEEINQLSADLLEQPEFQSSLRDNLRDDQCGGLSSDQLAKLRDDITGNSWYNADLGDYA